MSTGRACGVAHGSKCRQRDVAVEVVFLNVIPEVGIRAVTDQAFARFIFCHGVAGVC